MTPEEFNKLDNLWDYIEEQKNRSDIDENTYNILQKISDRLGNVIYTN